VNTKREGNRTRTGPVHSQADCRKGSERTVGGKAGIGTQRKVIHHPKLELMRKERGGVNLRCRPPWKGQGYRHIKACQESLKNGILERTLGWLSVTARFVGNFVNSPMGKAIPADLHIGSSSRLGGFIGLGQGDGQKKKKTGCIVKCHWARK